jgi:hypothetical protein
MRTPIDRIIPRGFALAAAIVLPALLVILYRYPPAENGWYPHCAFHRLTGLHCPGCGATRCVHALLHGDLRQAGAYNALFLGLLPALMVSALCQWWTLLTDRSLLRWRLPPWAIWVLFAVVLVFWVVRNLPWAPCTYLAPHELAGG